MKNFKTNHLQKKFLVGLFFVPALFFAFVKGDITDVNKPPNPNSAEQAYNDSFEWKPVQNGKERVIIVGRASRLGNAIAKNRDAKVKSDGFVKVKSEKGAKLESEMDTLVKDADVIVVNGNTVGGKLQDNEYIKGGLKYGVPIVLEKVSEADMTKLVGLGMPASNITVVTNYTDRNGANIEVLSNASNRQELKGAIQKTVFQEPNEDMKNKARQEGKDPVKLEMEAKKWQDQVKIKSKRRIPGKAVEKSNNDDIAKNVMEVVREKNKDIRRKININNESGGVRAVSPKNIALRSMNTSPEPYDFSKRIYDVTFDGWLWLCGRVQYMYQRIDLEVLVFASVQPYRKYVRLNVKDGSYIKPGTMSWNSEFNKGYITSQCKIRFDLLDADGSAFKLDKYAPANANPVTNYTSTTGLSVAGNIGVNKDSPSAGMTATYSETQAVSYSVNEFEVSASTGPAWAEFKFAMGKPVRDYIEPCMFCPITIKNLPASATSQLTPKCEVVFTAPGDYMASKSIQLKTTHSGINIRTEGAWLFANYEVTTHGQNLWSAFSVDFSKVSYPHLAIDHPTAASSIYSDWHSSRAVDGYIEGALSYAATWLDSEPYIQIDLESSKYINDIDIWNVIYFDPYYLSDYWVMVSDTPFTAASLNDAKKQSIRKEKCTGASPRVKKFNMGVAGRYVRVQREGYGMLLLGEIACNPRRD